MMFRVPYWLSPGWWLAKWVGRAGTYWRVDPKLWSWTGNWLVQQLVNIALVIGVIALASRY